MRISSLAYLTRQGWKNMINNRMMTVASVGILIACLFITGAAVLLGLNVNSFANYLAGQNEVVVYLLDGVEKPVTGTVDAPASEDPAGTEVVEWEAPAEENAGEQETAPEQPATQLVPVDINAAVAVLESIDNIDSYTYVSKDEALTEAIGWMGNYAELLEGYRSDNPMPASFRITVSDLEQLDTTVAALQTIEGVEYIKAPSEMAQILVSLKNAVNWIALGLVAVLGLVCIVVISNTIRLTVFARRREINIMKYVGATNAFIRWPFFVEGVTSGLIAALISFALLSLGYTKLVEYITSGEIAVSWLNNLFFSMMPYEVLREPLLITFLVVGVVLGGIGTANSVRKYLKV